MFREGFSEPCLYQAGYIRTHTYGSVKRDRAAFAFLGGAGIEHASEPAPLSALPQAAAAHPLPTHPKASSPSRISHSIFRSCASSFIAASSAASGPPSSSGKIQLTVVVSGGGTSGQLLTPFFPLASGVTRTAAAQVCASLQTL